MPVVRSHEWIDQRSLALARATAAKLRDNPALLGVARMNLKKWKHSLVPWPEAMAEWEAILVGDADTIIGRLVEDSPEGRRRRQSHPFAGVLTPHERQAIVSAYESVTV